MVAWFAGLFYIFRLFVYHVKFKDDAKMAAAYTLMESKLLKIIMYPAMILTATFGVLLVLQNPAVLYAGWFHLKILAVLLLIAYHIFATVIHGRFAIGEFPLSEKACRLMNEIPTILLMLIVILAVVKPF